MHDLTLTEHYQVEITCIALIRMTLSLSLSLSLSLALALILHNITHDIVHVGSVGVL